MLVLAGKRIYLLTSISGSTDSTDAVNISLVIPTPGGAKAIASFKPQFTYSLFGEQESIFGYKGLKINIAYNACDMRPNVNVSWEKKYKQLGETEALDIMPILEEFLPSGEKLNSLEVVVYTNMRHPQSLSRRPRSLRKI